MRWTGVSLIDCMCRVPVRIVQILQQLRFRQNREVLPGVLSDHLVCLLALFPLLFVFRSLVTHRQVQLASVRSGTPSLLHRASHSLHLQHVESSRILGIPVFGE